jgi:hypothetical protein
MEIDMDTDTDTEHGHGHWTKDNKLLQCLDQRANSKNDNILKSHLYFPLPSLIKPFNLQSMQQFTFNLLLVFFNNMWVTNAVRHKQQDQRELRNESDFYIQFSRLSSTDRHPIIYFPKCWNESAIEMKTIANKIFSIILF